MTTKVIQDIQEVWEAFKLDQGNQELRNRLIEQYFPLVRYNAERVWAKLPEGVDLNDLDVRRRLRPDGRDRGIRPDAGVKFETYCVPRIRGAMLDELRTMDWVPRLVRSKASKVEAARKQLEAAVRPASDGRRNGRKHGTASRRVPARSGLKPTRSTSSASTRSGTRPTATRTSAKSTFWKMPRAKIPRAASRSATS